MLERLIIVFIVVLTVGIVFFVIKFWQKNKANISVNGLKLNKDMPTIVYFSSPDCLVCKMQQEPVISQLSQKKSIILFHTKKINIKQKMDIARQWGIMTLPTTCIVNSHGTVKFINNGLVQADILNKQLNNSLN